MSSLEHLQNGRYTVLKMLGEGGKGIVWKARDTVLNRVVAIKMLKNPVTTGEAYSRFITEAQSVAKLNHPNIVSIHDIGKEDGKQFFVLEFVEGHSLRDLIESSPDGKCDISTILRVGIDVCSALQYAHSQGIMHRDVKPENIMITADGVAKLMDFGLAKMLGQPRQTQEGVIVGTVAYVAPEVALGKGADTRSDLYSLGAVLYEAVTGKPPFPGEDPVKIIFSHVHDHPISPDRLNPKLPSALSECIMKLLEKDPEKRYQSAADLPRILRDVAEESLREALPPTQKPIQIVPTPRPVARKEIPLIDRVEEMNQLKEAVDRAVRGEGGLLFLRGEAGIGKTRLTRELGAYARLRGMRVLYGRCPALLTVAGIPPYILWSEVIRDYLEASTAEQLYRVIGFYPGEVSKLVPQLGQRLGAVAQSLPIDPEHERDRLFEAVSQFITNISREAPLLVVLDDLQWTDQSSLMLLHYLARGVHKEHLLFVGAYRETEIDEKHPLSPVLTELNRERLLEAVSLRRMSPGDVSEMIKQILEQDYVLGEFCELVYRKTGGNPFFVEEVIKSLKEEQLIFREENQWKIKEVSGIEFPETVRGVVKARIGRLDDECRNLLTMASFVGYDFSFEALRGATGLDENKLVELLERMLKTGQIKEREVRGEDAYSFADAIVRDVVHEEVSRLMHKRFHNVVGSALEKVYANKIDDHLAELAYQFLEGNDRDKALGYFLKAGEKAQKTYAYGEAFSYLQQALELLEEKEGRLEEKVSVIERLGDLKAWMGQTAACMELWNRSLTLRIQLGDEKGVARLHAKMARILWGGLGDKEKASEHHSMALEILEKRPESLELARLYQDISNMIWRSGKSVSEALPYAQKAFELAERLRDPEVLSNCHSELGTISRLSGEFRKGIKYHEQGLKIALDNNCISSALRHYINLNVAYMATGEFQKAFEAAQQGSELAKRVGLLGDLTWLNTNGASSYAYMGEVQKAISMLKEASALENRINYLSHAPMTLRLLGVCYMVLGEWEKSSEHLTHAYEMGISVREFQASGGAMLSLGELSMEKGDYVEAEKCLKGSKSIYENAGSVAQLLYNVLPLLSKLYLRKGEIEKAQELIEKTYENATRSGSILVISRAEMLKAMLFREQKNWEQSLRFFEKSLQGYRSLNAEKWYVWDFAELLYEYGLMHLNRNEEGDKEEAYSLLNEALTIYQKMDAKRKIEKIIAKKKLLTA